MAKKRGEEVKDLKVEVKKPEAKKNPNIISNDGNPVK